MRNITLPSTTSILWSNIPPIEDWTDKLPKKQSWDELPGKKNIVRGVWDGTIHTGLRRPEDINTIVIHHAPPDARLEVHAKNHGERFGAGLAYHISIDHDRIKQTNNLLSFTWHCGGNNTYSVGIMINADLTKRDMTDTERRLLYAAILTVKSLLPIKHIRGHREMPGNESTACPATDMNRIREDVATLEAKLQAAAAAQVETWDEKMKKVNALGNQYNYMVSFIKKGEGDGNAQWAMNNLLDVVEIMKSKNLL